MLNGCRGAGIFLYRGFGTVIENCTVRNYNGDGISFQQSNDVIVSGCLSEDNSQLGLHPGSGSQRPQIIGCIARKNGTDGLFLCWRVRHGLFENNLLEDNGRFGISIGHKDTDNLLQQNKISRNGEDGVYFRDESFGMAPHRNQLKNNVIEDNGVRGPAAGIRVRGETDGLIFEGNQIRDTRQLSEQTQRVGIRIDQPVGTVALRDNHIAAQQAVQDNRGEQSQNPSAP
jgi:parallel beta-helix repeat protein